MSTKTCRKCGEDKPLSEYHRYHKMKDGYLNQCKRCCHDYRKQYAKDNPEKHRLAMKKLLLKQKYGITIEQWDEMYSRQGEVCAICGGVNDTKDLVVDHCHVTNEVRGLLCTRCNLGLGYFCDRIDLMENAVLYLKRQYASA